MMHMVTPLYSEEMVWAWEFHSSLQLCPDQSYWRYFRRMRNHSFDHNTGRGRKEIGCMAPTLKTNGHCDAIRCAGIQFDARIPTLAHHLSKIYTVTQVVHR